MARFVIDAPTLLHLVEHSLAVDPAHRLVAPNLIRSEALTLLLQAVRREELSERQALRHLDTIAGTTMRLLGDRVSHRTAWTIAREQSWETANLAEYVAVTRLQADAFVTIDATVAATVADLVPTAPVDALLAG